MNMLNNGGSPDLEKIGHEMGISIGCANCLLVIKKKKKFTFSQFGHKVKMFFLSKTLPNTCLEPRSQAKFSASAQGPIFWIRTSKFCKIHLVFTVAEESLSRKLLLKVIPNSSLSLLLSDLLCPCSFPLCPKRSIYYFIEHSFNDCSTTCHAFFQSPMWGEPYYDVSLNPPFTWTI